jgi:hypothetical protein
VTWGEVKKVIDEHVSDDAVIDYIDVDGRGFGLLDFDFEWMPTLPIEVAITN